MDDTRGATDRFTAPRVGGDPVSTGESGNVAGTGESTGEGASGSFDLSVEGALVEVRTRAPRSHRRPCRHENGRMVHNRSTFTKRKATYVSPTR